MKKKHKLKKKHKWLILSVSSVLLLIWVIWGNITVGLTQIKVSSTHLPKEFSGYRIAQVSDLHNAEFGDGNSTLIRLLKMSSPDIIVITGDLVDSNHTDIDVAMNFINQVVDMAPCYYITGNHEARLGNAYQELEEALTDVGVIILRDVSTVLERENQSIQIIGLDDPSFAGNSYMYMTSEEIISSKLQNMETTDVFKILLSHRPEAFRMYVNNNLDLVLSGHAHGGQVRFPFLGGLIAPNQGFFPKYDAGVYSKSNTTMVVSRGIGNSIVPIRVNDRPEIVIIELLAE